MIKILFVCHGRTARLPANLDIMGQTGAMQCIGCAALLRFYYE